jgi:hypothetical protein
MPEQQNVRARLRAAAEAEGDRLEQFFSEALAAEREVSITCTKCQRRTTASVADWSARLRAVELLIDQGYGKQRAVSNEQRDGVVIVVERVWPFRDRELDTLTDDERETLSAADEIRARLNCAAGKPFDIDP